MHKKSIEAAKKLNEDGDGDDDDDVNGDERCRDQTKEAWEREGEGPGAIVDKEERRSESIAALRAKAQTYSAKMREAIVQDESEAHLVNSSCDVASERDVARPRDVTCPPPTSLELQQSQRQSALQHVPRAGD